MNACSTKNAMRLDTAESIEASMESLVTSESTEELQITKSNDGQGSSGYPESPVPSDLYDNIEVNINLDASQLSYMVYYGVLDDETIEMAKQYDIVIIHPKVGNVTREQVQRIREGNTYVIGYLSIGEDMRTSGLTPEQMLSDQRFLGDGTGPRVDPRTDTTKLDGTALSGIASPAGTGYASYYLDDNDNDGTPDMNPNFNCAYVNIGDAAWYEVMDQMRIDGTDQLPGIREILTDDYGRGLGCDGLFLDTIDTCAPNSYTDESSPNITRFEWTAPGVATFMERLKEEYPDKFILQNRGLFFYNPDLPQYAFSPRESIDFLMFESYMLDANPAELYNENFYADNKFNYAPKIIAEGGRPDGFEILSLGYAEGPEQFHLKETLIEKSTAGLDVLLADMDQTQNELGFSHYITDGTVTLANSFVIDHEDESDDIPPRWSSTYCDTTIWPRLESEPRIGIQETEPTKDGVIVRWDVAFDKNDVSYNLYYQSKPFDFDNDPNLETAEKIELIPDIVDSYADGVGPYDYPYQVSVQGLESGEQYYFIIRAKDTAPKSNEEKNTVVLEETPL
jgi:hypothetical protein